MLLHKNNFYSSLVTLAINLVGQYTLGKVILSFDHRMSFPPQEKALLFL